MAGLTIRVLDGELAVARLAADAPLPAWAHGAPLLSITRSAEELSIVCPAALVPESVTRVERGWAVLMLVGPFAFDQTGVLASVAAPLAAAGVSLFALSTFDTDYVLVKRAQLERACTALRGAGHRLEGAGVVST